MLTYAHVCSRMLTEMQVDVHAKNGEDETYADAAYADVC
jgi:hypothetical protein